MAKSVTKLLLLATLLLLLGLPSYAQNTKGDRPQPRENRFRKGERPQKVKRSKQKKQPLSQGRGYRPSKKVNGSDRAARPVSPLRNTDPARSEKRSRAGALRRRGDS
ncbi:MAG TPA: hypothetical protein VEB86_18300, partial [Chryseosolibacter sp.]|nr:hypothetical protein [Chryseosolibacter sp.]